MFQKIVVPLSLVIALAASASAQFTRLSVGPEGQQAAISVDDPVISDDGTVVVYRIFDDQVLDPNDTNGRPDLYVYRRGEGHTRIDLDQIVNADTDISTWAISGDGSTLAIEVVSFAPCCTANLYVVNLGSGDITLASRTPSGDLPNGNSYDPALSFDGRRLAFASDASDLVAGDTNESSDIFVFDRQTLRVDRVSVSSIGAQANSSSYSPDISADGNLVVFSSLAANLEEPDARDTNAVEDVFLREIAEQDTIRLSKLVFSGEVIESNCDSYGPKISGDGSTVVFTSCATNLFPIRGGGNYFLVAVNPLVPNSHRIISAESFQGLQPCDFDGYRISHDGALVSAEIEYCFDFAARAGRPNEGNDTDNERAARGGSGLQTLMLIRTQNGQFDVLNSIDGNLFDAFDHDMAADTTADSGLIAFESNDPLVEEDTNEGEDVYLMESCRRSVFTTQPLSDTELVGGVAIFHTKVTTLGSTELLWLFNGQPLRDGGAISGADSPTLIINPVSTEHQGTYQLLVTEFCGGNESESVELVVRTDSACPGDADPNGVLNFNDITYLLSNFGPCSPAR